jgi:hypothetical protein
MHLALMVRWICRQLTAGMLSFSPYIEAKSGDSTAYYKI